MPLATVLYAVLLPLLVALGSTGLVRRRGGKKLSPRLAEVGLGLGFLAGFVAVARGIPFLNNVAHHQIGEIAVAALGLGVALALFSPGPRVMAVAGASVAVVAIFWSLGLGRLPAEDWLAAAVASVLAILVMWRLAALAQSGATAIMVLAIAAASLAVIAISARAGLLGDLALALAAACVGVLVWVRPVGKWRGGAIAVLAGGVVFVALAFGVARGALHTPWALIVLLPAFWADRLVERVQHLAKLARKQATRPLVLTAVAAVPALAAAVLSLLLA
jgi:hypothetical protein